MGQLVGVVLVLLLGAATAEEFLSSDHSNNESAEERELQIGFFIVEDHYKVDALGNRLSNRLINVRGNSVRTLMKGTDSGSILIKRNRVLFFNSPTGYEICNQGGQAQIFPYTSSTGGYVIQISDIDGCDGQERIMATLRSSCTSNCKTVFFPVWYTLPNRTPILNNWRMSFRGDAPFFRKIVTYDSPNFVTPIPLLAAFSVQRRDNAEGYIVGDRSTVGVSFAAPDDTGNLRGAIHVHSTDFKVNGRLQVEFKVGSAVKTTSVMITDSASSTELNFIISKITARRGDMYTINIQNLENKVARGTEKAWWNIAVCHDGTAAGTTVACGWGNKGSSNGQNIVAALSDHGGMYIAKTMTVTAAVKGGNKNKADGDSTWILTFTVVPVEVPVNHYVHVVAKSGVSWTLKKIKGGWVQDTTSSFARLTKVLAVKASGGKETLEIEVKNPKPYPNPSNTKWTVWTSPSNTRILKQAGNGGHITQLSYMTPPKEAGAVTISMFSAFCAVVLGLCL